MGRDRRSRSRRARNEVSIHAPAWGATRRRIPPLRLRQFQFTRPHGARHPGRWPEPAPPCFNSRARMGRDVHGWSPAGVYRVSIHAPAWGATGRPPQGWTGPAVSIHAPAWGATGGGVTKNTKARSFNSRARMGRDQPSPRGTSATMVSIHAPAWGATTAAAQSAALPQFQFTRPHGARPLAVAGIDMAFWFQFTRPHGARPHLDQVHLFRDRFNSRARMGRDVGQLHGPHRAGVSIHAPAWGATRPMAKAKYALQSFNSRARMGRDSNSLVLLFNAQFQFTRPHGARHDFRRRKPSLLAGFNSRARMGRDFPSMLAGLSSLCFNSRARMGRDGSRNGHCAIMLVSIHAPAWGATIHREEALQDA